MNKQCFIKTNQNNSQFYIFTFVRNYLSKETSNKIFRRFLKTPFVSYLIGRFWFYSHNKNMRKITCLCLIKFFNNNQKQSKKRSGRSTKKFS